MSTDKYKEFRNLLFNELRITKEDIRQWTREAAREAAESVARDHLTSEMMDQLVAAVARRELTAYGGAPAPLVVKAVKEAVAELVRDRVIISLSGGPRDV